MGLRCWKCHAEIGSLAIPVDEPYTPETLGEFLISNRILPVCNSCIKANPRYTSYENLPR
jgi:hypothetical protein